jgi:hypothetical protein
MCLMQMHNPWHPLMEDYKFTGLCNVSMVCICLIQCMILSRHGGTSSIAPSAGS